MSRELLWWGRLVGHQAFAVPSMPRVPCGCPFSSTGSLSTCVPCSSVKTQPPTSACGAWVLVGGGACLKGQGLRDQREPGQCRAGQSERCGGAGGREGVMGVVQNWGLGLGGHKARCSAVRSGEKQACSAPRPPWHFGDESREGLCAEKPLLCWQQAVREEGTHRKSAPTIRVR